MPRSKRKAGNGGAWKSCAAVDILRDGLMPSHLWLFHNIWSGEVASRTRAELKEIHEEAHAWSEAHNGLDMQPHTHGTPKARKEFNWDG